MKRVFCLIGLLILMISTIVSIIILWTTTIDIAIKIVASTAAILFTIIIFKLITKINNDYIKKLEVPLDKLVPEVKEETNKKLMLCPKCYQAFDGVVCFHCGFTKIKDDGHQN